MMYSLKFTGLTVEELLMASEAATAAIGSFAVENRQVSEEK